MANFEAVFFDLGSTLMYFDGNWREVYQRAIAAMVEHLLQSGLQLNQQAFQRDFLHRMEIYHGERNNNLIEYTAAHVLRSLLADQGYLDSKDALIHTALKAMYQVTQKHWHVEEDALATLDQLRRRGYRLGMISNAADDANVQALVDKAHLRPYFEVIYSSAAVGIRKPNPRLFELALRALATAPWRAAMVGDMLGTDILGAQSVGMFAIWITRRAEESANQPYLSTVHPNATITTLRELPDLLDTLTREKGDAG
jgi:putative hydrolase of the HAD superfamily